MNSLSKEKALKVIERLEGTLIADLKSLKIIAEERERDKLLQEQLPGAFNFTVFLTGLVACETLGYLINAKSRAVDTKNNIEHLLSRSYCESSAFNKKNYKDALVSLRTKLAHVYGMTGLRTHEVDKDLILCVGGSSYPEIISSQKTAKLNGIKFIELIVKAFESIKSEVSTGNDGSDIVRSISEK